VTSSRDPGITDAQKHSRRENFETHFSDSLQRPSDPRAGPAGLETLRPPGWSSWSTETLRPPGWSSWSRDPQTPGLVQMVYRDPQTPGLVQLVYRDPQIPGLVQLV